MQAIPATSICYDGSSSQEWRVNSGNPFLKGFNLLHHSEAGVIVCTRTGCRLQSALEPDVDEIAKHLISHRQVLLLEEREKLQSLLEFLKLKELSEVVKNLRGTRVQAIKQFDVKDGCFCSQCQEAFYSKSSCYNHINSHCKGAVVLKQGVRVQQLLKAKNRLGFIQVREEEAIQVVDTDEEEKEEETLPDPDAAPAHVGRMVQIFKDHQTKLHSKLEISLERMPVNKGHLALLGTENLWSKYLGWTDFWKDAEVVQIGRRINSKASQWTDDSQEWFLSYVYSATERLMLHLSRKLTKASKAIQSCLNQYQTSERLRPFSLDDTTIRRRAQLWGKLISLLCAAILHPNLFGLDSKSEVRQHFGIEERTQGLIEDLASFCSFANSQFDMEKVLEGEFEGASQVFQLLYQISLTLVIQVPKEVGDTESLAFSRLLFPMFLNKAGVCIPVLAATSILASLDFCMRAIIHGSIFDEDFRHDIRHPSDNDSIQECLQQRTRNFLFSDSFSANSHLQMLLRKGTTLASSSTGGALAMWSPDLSSVTCKGVTVGMISVKSMIKELVDKAGFLLHDLLLLSKETSWEGLLSNLSNAHDNFHCSKPGFNMLEATKTPPDTLIEVAIQQAMGEFGSGTFPSVLSLPTSDDEEPTVNTVPAQAYLRKVDQFLEVLILLIYLTGGMPPRGTELLSIQHTNSVVCMRNLFIHSGRVFTVISKNKTAGRRGAKIIPRFLPYRVGEMLVTYLCLVLPYANLVRDLLDTPSIPSSLLAVDTNGKLWDSNRLSEKLEEFGKLTLGQPNFTISTWRHIATAIDRKFIRPDQEAEKLDSPHDLQAGHSTETAEQHYAIDADMMKQLSTETMEAMWSVSKRWHQFWGFESEEGAERKLGGNREEQSAERKLNKGKGREQEGGEGRTEEELVSTYSSAISKNVVRSVKRLLEDHLEGREDGSKRARLDNQETKQVPTPSSSNSHLRKQLGITLAGSQEYAWPAVFDWEVAVALKAVTGSTSAKCPAQARGLAAIRHQVHPLIIVMGTGSGKTALMLAPLRWLAPGSTVVVVVPFIALMNDLMLRAEEANIKAAKWLGATEDLVVPNDVQLVAVSSEACSSQGFITWATEVEHHGRLKAVFLDECHTILLHQGFRPKMGDIRQLLSKVHVPQYMLTATLPPEDEGRLKQELCLPPHTGILRNPTNRLNISYRVKTAVEKSDALEIAKREIEACISGQILVICQSKADAISTAEKLGLSCYHADMGEGAREDVLKKWFSTAQEDSFSNRALVGTTAIGTGVDPGNVKLVIHLGGTFSLVDYAQESGRAARRDGTGTALLIWTPKGESRTDRNVKEYVETKGCRREVLSRYLDGTAFCCWSERDTEPCDRCIDILNVKAGQQGSVSRSLSPDYNLSGADPTRNPFPAPPLSSFDMLIAGSKVPTPQPGEFILPAHRTPSPKLIAGSKAPSPKAGGSILRSNCTPSPRVSTCLVPETPVRRQDLGHSPLFLPRNLQNSSSLGMDVQRGGLISPPRTEVRKGRGQLEEDLIDLFSSDPSSFEQKLIVEAEFKEMVKEGSRQLMMSCGPCKVFGPNHHCEDHTFSNCQCVEPVSGSRVNYSHLGKIRRMISFEPKAACYSCLFPRSICKRNLTNKACSFPDVVLPVVAAILLSKDKLKETLKAANMDENLSAEEITSRLGKRMPLFKETSCVAFVLFAAIVAGPIPKI